jgi:hypothetical protein
MTTPPLRRITAQKRPPAAMAATFPKSRGTKVKPESTDPQQNT